MHVDEALVRLERTPQPRLGFSNVLKLVPERLIKHVWRNTTKKVSVSGVRSLQGILNGWNTRARAQRR